MAHAQLTVDISNDWGSDAFVPSDSETVCWMLAMLPVDAALQTIAEIQSYDIDGVTETLRHHQAVIDSELLYQTPTRAIMELEMERPVFYTAAHDCGVPIIPPIALRAETATFETRGTGPKLTELIETLEHANCSPTIDWIQNDTDPHQLLSVRQREFVTAAIELGYYDSPRECTLTELSEHLGIAKSTCSDVLHRAEGTLIRWYLKSFGRVAANDESSRDIIFNSASSAMDASRPDDHAVESSHGQPAEEFDPDKLLTLFANENVRSVFCQANTPKTAQELASECELSVSTSYRLANKLEQANLLVPAGCDETNSMRYRRAIRRARFRIGDTVSVTCEPFVDTDLHAERTTGPKEE